MRRICARSVAKAVGIAVVIAVLSANVFMIRDARAVAASTHAPVDGAAPAGSSVMVCDQCPAFVRVPGGELIRPEELRREPGRLQLDGFLISETEVTVAQYRECVEDGICRAPARDIALEYQPDFPIVYVSWAGAVDYTRWLSEKTGYAAALPTEAEWEYAALGGHSDDFFGAKSLRNVTENCRGCALPSRRGALAPVGLNVPNRYGVFDAYGNVQEWTSECAPNTEKGFFGDDKAVFAPFCEMHVVKGGSFKSNPEKNSIFFRSLIYAGCFDDAGRPMRRSAEQACKGYHQQDLGFRIVIRNIAESSNDR